ncbi:hypothetical protein DL96DRAFT_1147040 [Flagelloscypha sp. PMI_526]|nr:hypothetical protein DL96DRAFT_1147040 [Flagelloscypha sp. PMI_526]
MSSHKFPDIALERLLRPLRSKVSSLAKIANMHSSRHALAHYYSTGTIQYTVGTWNDRLQGDVPPLFILPRPGARLNGANHPRPDCDVLSKAIYDVQSAFEDLLAKMSPIASSSPKSKVKALTGLCAIFLGNQIGIPVEGLEDDGIDDDPQLEGEELYQMIPPTSRREAVLAQALDLFVYHSPPIPTLLTILLDTCLVTGETYCAHGLLRALLSSAFSTPSNSVTPKVCYKQHSSFLIKLFDSCTNAGMHSREFGDILWAALQASGCTAALTSVAMERLADRLLQDDPIYFTQTFCFQLMVVTTNVLRGNDQTWVVPISHKKKQKMPLTSEIILAKLLVEWLIKLCRQAIDSQLLDSDVIEDLLEYSLQTHLHTIPIHDETTWTFSPIFTTLATTILAFTDDCPRATAFLQRCTVSPISYHPFIARIFVGNASKKPLILSEFTECERIVMGLTDALDRKNQFRLLIAWISATSRSIDEILEEYSSTPELNVLRRRLENKLGTIQNACKSSLGTNVCMPNDISLGASHFRSPSVSVLPSIQPLPFTSLLSYAMASCASIHRRKRPASLPSTRMSSPRKRSRVSYVQNSSEDELGCSISTNDSR